AEGNGDHPAKERDVEIVHTDRAADVRVGGQALRVRVGIDGRRLLFLFFWRIGCNRDRRCEQKGGGCEQQSAHGDRVWPCVVSVNRVRSKPMHARSTIAAALLFTSAAAHAADKPAEKATVAVLYFDYQGKNE